MMESLNALLGAGDPVASRRGPRDSRPGGLHPGTALPARGRRPAAAPGLLPRRRLGARRPRVARQPLPEPPQRRRDARCWRSTIVSRPSTGSLPRWTTATPRRAWAVANAATLGCDPKRVAVGGDSAGGNLTAVVAQLARDRGTPSLRFQLLVYPATDAALRHASYRENATGYFLELDGMRWFYDHYLGDGDRSDPRASPLRTRDLRGLPPALVITAEFDPLRDEGEAYAGTAARGGRPRDAAPLRRHDPRLLRHGLRCSTRASRSVAEAAAALRTALR